MRSPSFWLSGLLVAAACAVPGAARAQAVEEPWFFVGDLGVTGALNDPLTDQFEMGAESSFTVYRSLIPHLAVGGQLRLGVLGEGQVIQQDPVARGLLDYEMLTVNLRLRPFAGHMDTERRATGLFLEASGGASLLDGDAVPVWSAALGYSFGIGPIAIGPKVRFTHFIETQGRFVDNDVLTLTGAIELAFLDSAQVTPVAQMPTARLDVDREWEREEQIAEGSDRDGDFILDENDQCPDQAEVLNGFEDADGCPDEGTGQFVNDALTVDERVFFDYDEAELREAGIEQLNTVVEHYREHANDIEKLVVSGYADARGTIPYNEDLSLRRAEAVVEYLTSRGVPREAIDVRAYGELRPEILEAESEYDHQVNRRVAFDVRWAEGRMPVGIAPEPNPNMPEYVDEAPPSVRERERRADIRAREARERRLAIAELRRVEQEERALEIAAAEAERREELAELQAERAEDALN